MFSSYSGNQMYNSAVWHTLNVCIEITVCNLAMYMARLIGDLYILLPFNKLQYRLMLFEVGLFINPVHTWGEGVHEKCGTNCDIWGECLKKMACP